jgi:hypothetical protein
VPACRSYEACSRLFTDQSPVLDEEGKAALKAYFASGGNFVGIHCASATLYNDDFYLKRVGKYPIRDGSCS